MPDLQPIPSLADVLFDHLETQSGGGCLCGWAYPADAVDVRPWVEHVEAEYWKVRVVHDREQLDELPINTTVSDLDQFTFAKEGTGSWYTTAEDVPVNPGLPTTVLRLPGEGS